MKMIPSLHRSFKLVAAVLACALPGAAATAAPLDASLRNEINIAYDKALEWLTYNQNPDGSWSMADYPAITALALRGYLDDPQPEEDAMKRREVQAALAFIASCAQPDGGIYRKGLGNYNTAISIAALNRTGDPIYDPLIRAGRAYVVQQQQLPGMDSPFHGGIGYGNSYKHSDMSNTSLAIQSLHETRNILESAAAEGDPRLDWAAAIKFLERSQNLPQTNDMDWASESSAERGGFVYFPGNSKAGEYVKEDGGTGYHSYGSMTYAGLMSFLYAELEPDDIRVTAAVDWLSANWTLDENPGMDQQGLFYYYMTMAKALNALGTDTLTLDNGKTIKWREELAVKLIDIQSHAGFWVNSSSRWMEADPVLVTAYVLTAFANIWN